MMQSMKIDCISRAEVLDLCDSKDPNYEIRHLKEDVECLPSVYPLSSVTPQEPILDKIFNIVFPLSIMSTPDLEHKAIMQIAEMLEPLCLPESEAEDGFNKT